MRYSVICFFDGLEYILGKAFMVQFRLPVRLFRRIKEVFHGNDRGL